MEMKTHCCCLALLLLAVAASNPIAAEPQDLESGLLLAAAQMKSLMETGAGGSNAQSAEVFGQKLSGNMALGFGDAVQSMGGGGLRRRRRRRATINA